MTVKELIQELSKYDEDMVVGISLDEGVDDITAVVGGWKAETGYDLFIEQPKGYSFHLAAGARSAPAAFTIVLRSSTKFSGVFSDLLLTGYPESDTIVV